MTQAPSTSVPQKPFTASNAQIWAWGIGGIAAHSLICTYGLAGTIFAVGFGLSPVLVSWTMMLPRLVDGIVDPIIGHISDDTHTRWGRRKPFMVVGSIAGALLLAAVWWANPAWNSTAQFLYLLLIETLFYIAYGIYTMAWTAVGYELSDDYNERSRVAAVGGLFLSLVLLGQGWTYWFALRPMFGQGVGLPYQHTGVAWLYEFAARQLHGDATIKPNEITGMRWISAGVGVLVVAAALVATLVCRERFTHTNRTHIAMLPAIKTTFRNRPFLILLLIKVCQIFGDRAAGGLLSFISIYYVCGGDKDLATKIGGIGATIGTIWGFVLVPAMKPISQYIGKRMALVISAAVAFGAALLGPFVLTPAHPYWTLVPTLVVAPLICISNTLSTAIVPDICDLDELQTGQRREGLFTAVMGVHGKAGNLSLCGHRRLPGRLDWSGHEAARAASGCVAASVLDGHFLEHCLHAADALLPAHREIDGRGVRRQLDARHRAHPEIAPEDEAIANV